QLNNVSSVIAQALYTLAYPNGTDVMKTDLTVTNQLLYCFMYRPNCTLLRTVLSSDNARKLANRAYSRYVGVYRADVKNQNSFLVSHLLHYYLGEAIPNVTNKEHCHDLDMKDA
ncbi:uncharacterized protein LOC144361246, partial [Saccoglossus kowalevskii]